LAGGLDGRAPDPAAGSPGERTAGLPAGEPRRVSGAIRFGSVIPCPFSFPGPAGRCPVLVAVMRAAVPGSGGRGAAARGRAGEMRRRRALPAMSRSGGGRGRGGDRAGCRIPGGRRRAAGARRDPGRRGRRLRGRLAEGRRDQRVELRVQPLRIRADQVGERRVRLAGADGHADHPPRNLR